MPGAVSGVRRVAIGCLAMFAAGCGSPPVVPPPSTAPVDITVGVPYRGGQLDVVRPRGADDAPVVVLLHGCCGGREDLIHLAAALAERGLLAINAGWTPFPSGGTYPEAVGQATCAVRFARDRAAEHGGDPGRVAVLGWSDGALVGAGVAYGTGPVQVPCGPVAADAFVGVSGNYGWPVGGDPFELGLVHPETVTFFGGLPGDEGASWEVANPFGRLAAGPPGGALLLVGDEDPLRPTARCFGAALHAAGHDARLVEIFRAGHGGLISPRSPEGREAVAEIAAFLGGDGPPVPPVAAPECDRA